ncbi:signal transduction histidine kinase [Actinoplanes tereljensis]|uniref:histidine kinase n=1 Tax=Paractinoplanes tereljensis TaxID=571912 RepID=A0A919TUN9_9ACTN|nr:histidine kinase [Actinoplanes tereljensis]GIF21545.1 hypothetical protein Ate02nite_42750 [Actinoplanes tereljensis]
MKPWRTWLLPALLVAVQFALWPRHGVPSLQAAGLAGTTLAIGAALLWRRTRPVLTMIVVSTLIPLTIPQDSLLVISTADLVALFSVAARRDSRTTALATTGAVLVQAVVTAFDDEVGGDYWWIMLAVVAVYVMVAALGHRRGQWVRARTEAADRLAAAEEAEREAATAERHRLARELHDVSAHHLTSIVISASAAEMLSAQRPELRPEALTFAARTGQDTLAALHRLVAILPADELPPDRPQSLSDLAEAFDRLGQQVTTDLPPGDPPAAVADAAYGIAREALTNTLRYAPGGPVQLLLRYGREQAELTIDNDAHPAAPTAPGSASGLAPAAPGLGGGLAAAPGLGGDRAPAATGLASAAAGLGGGRGIPGMHERAATVGGTVTAGPRADGGWRVRAVLPLTSLPVRRQQWSPVALDAVLVALLLVVPFSSLAVSSAEDGLTVPGAALVVLAVLAHTVPLFWRRSHPWPVFAAVAATTWLGPLLVGLGVIPAGAAWLFLFSAGAEFAAVYSVASRAVPARLTWLSAGISAISSAAALGTLIALEPPDEPGVSLPGRILIAVFLAVVVAILLAIPATLSWLAGHLERRRRDRRQAREEAPVAAAMFRAADQARGERARVAAGLRAAVLQHAAQVPTAAAREDLPAVVAAARHALAAMRALLDGLSHPTTPPNDPAPVAAPVAAVIPDGVGPAATPVDSAGLMSAPLPRTVPPGVAPTQPGQTATSSAEPSGDPGPPRP